MFLIRWSTPLFVSYIVVSVALLFALETPFNEGFVQSVAWLSLPILLLSAAFTRRYLEEIELTTEYSPRQIWAYTVLTAAVLILMSWPYVLLVNAATADGVPTNLGGKVVEKFGTNRGLPVLVLHNEVSGSVVRLSVHADVYAKLAVGSIYSECYLLGPLGFAYRWKHAQERPRCPAAAASAA